MKTPPDIAVLMETGRSFGRGVIRGIVQYTRVHEPWLFYIHPGDLTQPLPPRQIWDGNGVIGRVPSRKVANEIAQRKLKLVVMGGPVGVGPRLIGTSVENLCHAAFDHLKDRGFTRVGWAGGHEQRPRRDAFVALAAREGFPCDVFSHQTATTGQQHASEQARLSAWLQGLKKPIGLLAAHDLYGRFLLDTCRIAGVHVPEEIAVVGIDNDELICEMATPPLSSVALNAERIGFEAAGLMDQLLRGKHPKHWIEVEPLGVVARQSSDILAIDDPDVARAVRFIRDHACDGINTSDITRQVVCSERSLQLKFQKLLHRSPYEEVRRVRLERAKELLLRSDLKLHRIAESCGLRNAQHLFAIFREMLDLTPSEFRRQARAAGN